MGLDARALNLTQRQLKPGADSPPTNLTDLTEAVKAASPAARALIFAEAQQLRRDNWRAHKEEMARTIPVFRALIASDPEERSHRFYGQLGYCLKDQAQPAWKEAEAELTKAIELRGRRRKDGNYTSSIERFARLSKIPNLLFTSHQTLRLSAPSWPICE